MRERGGKGGRGGRAVAYNQTAINRWRRHRWKARNRRKRLPKLIRVPIPPHRLYK